MFPPVLDEKGKSERRAVRKSEDAIEGAFCVDDVVEEVVRILHGLFVVVIVVESPRPVVVAVVGTLVNVFDARAGAAADLAANVDERCAVVFFEVASDATWVAHEHFDTIRLCNYDGGKRKKKSIRKVGVRICDSNMSSRVPAPCRQRNLRLGMMVRVGLYCL